MSHHVDNDTRPRKNTRAEQVAATGAAIAYAEARGIDPYELVEALFAPTRVSDDNRGQAYKRRKREGL